MPKKEVNPKKIELDRLLRERTTLEKNLVKAIREYSLSQSGLWLRVPNLALEADGRGGYSDSYMRAFSSGYWTIDSSSHGGIYTVFVDLSNGELINPLKLDKEGKDRLAWDERVLEIAQDIDQINAEVIIDELMGRTESEYGSWQTPKDVEYWREEQKAKMPEIFRNK